MVQCLQLGIGKDDERGTRIDGIILDEAWGRKEVRDKKKKKNNRDIQKA
jgi:hypothetical protein